jgi:cellulose synthase/poly-beta-1,6-N-acetylglucosamine synthase-like glycosyltransferase
VTIIFYLLPAILIYFSYRSFRGGIDYLNYFKKELRKPRSSFAPFATIICPCKRHDDGLALNLARLFEQDYPSYEIIFVVDDENDPAVSVIKNAFTQRLKDIETRHRSESDRLQPKGRESSRGHFAYG